MRIVGAVLAGGRATRLGGVPKPLIEIGGRPMLERALDAIRGNVGHILVSANQPELYGPLGYEIVPDTNSERLGPLAGLAALSLSLGGAEGTMLMTVAGDTPFLPPDLGARLLHLAEPGTVRVASHRDRWQPTVALWPLQALHGLPAWLETERSGRGLSLRAWIERHPHETLDFPRSPWAPEGDPFFNVNTPAELEAARRHLP